MTAALKIYFEIELDVYASTKEIILSEEGFQCLANKELSEFKAEDYFCLILPGILMPMPALFDQRNIDFLRSLKDKELLIAAISSAPMLLAKAGLLEDVKFTSGIWDEIARGLDFIPYKNICHKPLVKDKNIITAIGFAFREFAEEVIRTAGISECEKGLFRGVVKEYTEEELTYRMGEENFALFMREYQKYQSAEDEKE